MNIKQLLWLAFAIFIGPTYFLTWRFNHQIFFAINGFLGNLFGLPMIVFTALADGHFIIMLSALAYRKKKGYYWSFLIAYLISAGLVNLIKNGHSSGRPLAYFPPDQIFYEGEVLRFQSFPSGHSAAAMALARYLMHEIHNIKLSVAIFCFGAICALSRVYIGAHFPLDVLAGGLIGFTICHIVLNLSRYKYRDSVRKDSKNNPLIISILGLSSAIIYIIFDRNLYPPVSGAVTMLAGAIGVYFMYYVFIQIFKIYNQGKSDLNEL